jgi:hypothetical protein
MCSNFTYAYLEGELIRLFTAAMQPAHDVCCAASCTMCLFAMTKGSITAATLFGDASRTAFSRSCACSRFFKLLLSFAPYGCSKHVAKIVQCEVSTLDNSALACVAIPETRHRNATVDFAKVNEAISKLQWMRSLLRSVKFVAKNAAA